MLNHQLPVNLSDVCAAGDENSFYLLPMYEKSDWLVDPEQMTRLNHGYQQLEVLEFHSAMVM